MSRTGAAGTALEHFGAGSIVEEALLHQSRHNAAARCCPSRLRRRQQSVDDSCTRTTLIALSRLPARLILQISIFTSKDGKTTSSTSSSFDRLRYALIRLLRFNTTRILRFDTTRKPIILRFDTTRIPLFDTTRTLRFNTTSGSTSAVTGSCKKSAS